MAQHDDIRRLQDILSHAREAMRLVEGVSQDHLRQDRVLELALTRLLEIIGEAAARISPYTQSAHRDIPWSLIIGMRNRLIHGYEHVDVQILWGTVVHDLPPLVTRLQAILEAPSE